MLCLKEWNVINNPQPHTHAPRPLKTRHPRATRPAQILFFLLVVLGALSGCSAFQEIEENVHQVWKGLKSQQDESDLVRASGTIQANEVRIASEFGGRIDTVHVQAGMPVQVGDTLVSLDATFLEDRLAEAEAEVKAAQMDLAAVLAELPQEEREVAQAAVAMAVAERTSAQLVLENARQELENPQALDAQIIEAQTQVRLAEQAAILAEAELARQKLLAQQKKKGSDERRIADFQVVAAENALSAAQADQAATQTLLDWLITIRHEPLGTIARVHAAEADVQLAEHGIHVAQAKLRDLEAGPTLYEIAVAQARVRLAQAQSDVIRTQIEQYVLRSPLEGLVLSQILDQGELAAPTAAILVIARLDPVMLTVYVPVNQIGQINLGQPVDVQVDSYLKRTFEGHVSRIGDEPEFTPRNIATQEERLNTFYAVQVELENPDHLLKPGMPADATLVQSKN